MLLSLMLAFSTMLFPYASQLWAHTTAAAFVIFSLVMALAKDRRSLFFSGVAIGCAVLCDYLIALLVPAILLLVLLRGWRGGLYFCLGGIPLALLLGYYHYLCFGSPLAFPTDFTNPEFIDEGHVMGLFGALSLENLWQLTFGRMRGMFYAMPLLFLTPIGLFRWWRREPRDPWLWLCLYSIVVFLFVNASFNGWHAGATVCARYQIAVMPFWILPLKELIDREWMRKLALVLATLSFSHMLMTNAVSPIAPDVKGKPNPDPFTEWVYPHFFKGEFANYKFPIRLQQLETNYRAYMRDTTFNLGQRMGLGGVGSLIPLIMLAIPLALALLRAEGIAAKDRGL